MQDKQKQQQTVTVNNSNSNHAAVASSSTAAVANTSTSNSAGGTANKESMLSKIIEKNKQCLQEIVLSMKGGARNVVTIRENIRNLDMSEKTCMLLLQQLRHERNTN